MYKISPDTNSLKIKHTHTTQNFRTRSLFGIAAGRKAHEARTRWYSESLLLFVSWCFQPSQPLRATSGLNSKFVNWCFEPSWPLGIISGQQDWIRILIYPSVTLQAGHLTSTTICLQHNYWKHTHTHKITHISAKPQTFCITVKIFLHQKISMAFNNFHTK